MKKEKFKTLRILSGSDFCTDVSADRGRHCIFI